MNEPLLINNKPAVLNVGARIRLTTNDLIEYDDHIDINVDLSGVCDPVRALELATGGKFSPVIREER